jgi:DNA-directed RNA polymerase subunit RPC12/RpoP
MVEYIPKKYKCLGCDKEFKTLTGRWKHQEKHHPSKGNNMLTNLNDMSTNVNENVVAGTAQLASLVKYACEHCNKNYKSRQGLWKHKSVCEEAKNTDEIIELKEKNKQLEEKNNRLEEMMKTILEKMNDLENKTINNKNSVNTNNGQVATTINNITINEIKDVNHQILDNDTKKTILEKIKNSDVETLLSLLDALYFNPEHPENHTIYKTNYNNNIIHKFDKKSKRYVIDDCNKIIETLAEQLAIYVDEIKDELKERIDKRVVKLIEKYLAKIDNNDEDDDGTNLKEEAHKEMRMMIVNKTNELGIHKKAKELENKKVVV